MAKIFHVSSAGFVCTGDAWLLDQLLDDLSQSSNIKNRLPIGPIEKSNLLNLTFFPILIRESDKNSQSDEIFNTIVVEPDWPHCPIGQG